MITALIAVLAGWWLWTPDLPRAALEAKYLERPADLIGKRPLLTHCIAHTRRRNA
jgi:hypothetical protein